MKYSIAVISGLLVCISCNSSKLPESINNRLYVYDTQSVFLPIIRSEKLSKYFPENIFKKYYDKEEHNFDLTKDNGLFYKEFSLFFDKLKDTSVVLNVIDNWCTTNEFINNLGEINPDYPSEAILFFTEETRFLVNRYFTDPQQSWYSLSSFQLYELNIAFLNYVDKLTINEKEQLFLHLKETTNRLSSEK